jgi:hypothetical protein
MYKTIIPPVVSYECETWSLTLSEEHRLIVFENRVLRRISGPKMGGVMGEWRKLHSENLHMSYSSPDIISKSSRGKLGGQGMWHAWERRGKCTRFWWESPKERDYLEDKGVKGRM